MDMSRRDFVTSSGRMLAALGIAGSGLPLLAGSEPLRPGKRQTGIGRLGALEAEIIRLATLAPSGHNAQPWTVKVLQENAWITGIDKSRLLPAVDPDNREVMLSLGAFLENMIQAAGHYGYSVRYRVMTDDPMETDILSVKLLKTKPVAADTRSIEKRRTLRKGMSGVDISGSDFSRLTGGVSDSVFYFSRESMVGKMLCQGIIEANMKQAWREPAQVELSRWIRLVTEGC